MIADLIKPLPGPVVTWPKAARPPERCAVCFGTGEEVREGGRVGQCETCNGTGNPPLDLYYLDRTRTYDLRGIAYEPRCGNPCGRLVISKRKASAADEQPGGVLRDIESGRQRKIEQTGYEVEELPSAEPEHREFVLHKLAHGSAVKYHATLSRSGVRCDCKGRESLASGHANQKAYEAGGRVFPTYGCCHLDALAALLLGGWFDLD